MEFFKPGTDIQYMKKKNLFMVISAILVFLSLVSITFFKFNMGIDFKGGTKIIISFKKGNPVDRGKIKDVLRNHIENEIGEKGIQIEVQDFDVGGAGEEESIKFLIFTDMPNLLTPLKKLEISNKIKGDLPPKTKIETSFEAGDKFFVLLPEEKPVREIKEKIKDIFKKIGFERVEVLSDKEEKFKIEYFKERNLILSEHRKDEDIELMKIEKKLEDEISKINDDRYTIFIEEIKSMVSSVLKKNFKNYEDVISTTNVSAAVGLELFQSGLLAILYAIVGMLIYIAIRFDVRFAPGAIIALIHDTIITMGVLSFFQIKFTLPIVAALLTIVGYSVNDTIVVYDRIRENIRKGKFSDLLKTINVSINETMSRTILTSATTLLVVIALFFLGGGLIKDFALALLVGITIGTYSSIFIASPITYYLDLVFKKKGI